MCRLRPRLRYKVKPQRETSKPASLARERTCLAPWRRPRRGCGRRGPRLRDYARFRVLEQRELARAVLRITYMRATQPSRILGGLGSSRPHVSHPTLSRAAGRCTVRRHHRSRCDERHAPPTLRAAHPHAPRATARPRTTSTGAFIVDGETALQLTQRRGAVSQARSFIARRCATERGQESARIAGARHARCRLTRPC